MLSLVAERHWCTLTIKEGKLQLISQDEALETTLLVEWRFDVSKIAGMRKKGYKLLNAITESIDPDSWEENGGEASASFENAELKVKQTLGNLMKINGVLQQLHQVARGE